MFNRYYTHCNTKDESKHVQSALFSIGCGWSGRSTDHLNIDVPTNIWFSCGDNSMYYGIYTTVFNNFNHIFIPSYYIIQNAQHLEFPIDLNEYI